MQYRAWIDKYVKDKKECDFYPIVISLIFPSLKLFKSIINNKKHFYLQDDNGVIDFCNIGKYDGNEFDGKKKIKKIINSVEFDNLADDDKSLLKKIYKSQREKKWREDNREHFTDLVKGHTKVRRKELRNIIIERKNKPCKICNKKHHHSAMDFFHKNNSNKLFRISDAVKKIFSIEKLMEELDKCELYCSNCLRQKTYVDLVRKTIKNSKSNQKKKKLLELVNKFKDKKCADCGKKYPPYIMDLDHLGHDEKYDNVSTMINSTLGIKRVEDEMNKTEPVCSNCHRIRTYNRREGFNQEMDE